MADLGRNDAQDTQSTSASAVKSPPPHSDGVVGAASENVGVISTSSVNPTFDHAAQVSTTRTAPTNSSCSQQLKDRHLWHATTTNAIHGSVRGRLPPTIDNTVAPYCAKARQAFLAALIRDQLNALGPDYRSAFHDVTDVIQRLLPYHVWHVRDGDLLHVMNSASGRTTAEEQVVKLGNDVDREDNSVVRKDVRREACKRKSAIEKLGSHMDHFPSQAEAYSLWSRFRGIESRAQLIRRRLNGSDVSQAPAPFYQESCYHIEHLARETELNGLNAQKEEFREAKEQAMSHGVTWEALMRISAGLQLDNVPILRHSDTQLDTATSIAKANWPTSTQSTSISAQQPAKMIPSAPVSTSFASQGPRPPAHSSFQAQAAMRVPNPSSRPIGPSTPVRGSRPRGRPRKQRDEQGRIIRTPPVATSTTAPTLPVPSSTPTSLTAMQQQHLESVNAAKKSAVVSREQQASDAVTHPTFTATNHHPK